tara:strand:- start:107 stop:553 length:447 start_codon:yes stop_codon:yes gene_type:complete
MQVIKFIILVIILLLALPILVLSQANAAQTDEDCMAEAIYFEGRSEPIIGQLAIANVILNRITVSVCDTVHDRCQFSYWCDGKLEDMTDIEAKNVAYSVGRLALDGATVGQVEGATHYHANYVNPKWSKDLLFLNQIGVHLFYSEYEK